MLKYHLLLPNASTTHQAHYLHYLTTGSHLAPYGLKRTKGLSVVTLHPHQTLPTLEHENKTAVVPLSGTLRVEGKEAKKREIVRQPKDLSTGEENATFLFVAKSEGEEFLTIKEATEEECTFDLHKATILLI